MQLAVGADAGRSRNGITRTSPRAPVISASSRFSRFSRDLRDARRREIDFALVAGGIALVLSLGPQPRVFDRLLDVPLPWSVLERIFPALDFGGCVNRFEALAFLPLALATALAFERLLARRTRTLGGSRPRGRAPSRGRVRAGDPGVMESPFAKDDPALTAIARAGATEIGEDSVVLDVDPGRRRSHPAAGPRPRADVRLPFAHARIPRSPSAARIPSSARSSTAPSSEPRPAGRRRRVAPASMARRLRPRPRTCRPTARPRRASASRGSPTARPTRSPGRFQTFPSLLSTTSACGTPPRRTRLSRAAPWREGFRERQGARGGPLDDRARVPPRSGCARNLDRSSLPPRDDFPRDSAVRWGSGREASAHGRRRDGALDSRSLPGISPPTAPCFSRSRRTTDGVLVRALGGAARAEAASRKSALLVAQGVDGVEARGLHRRVDPEEEADRDRHAEPEEDAPERRLRAQARDEAHDERGQEAEGRRRRRRRARSASSPP